MDRRQVTAVGATSAVVVYAAMWLGYGLQWRWLHWLDFDTVNALRRYSPRHPGWVRFWDVFCTVFGPDGFRVVGLLVIALAAWLRNVRAALFVLVCVGLSGVLTETAKRLADRPRPSAALVHAASSAFPSGHAVAAMAGVLALLTVVAHLLGRAERVAAAIGAVIVIAVGFGRIALFVHYVSDVVAGLALGYLWFLVCLFVFRPQPLTCASGGQVPPRCATAVPPR